MQINALVLAGGASRRMGKNKLALPVATGSQISILRRVVDIACGVTRNVTVVGPPEPQRPALLEESGGPWREIQDPQWYQGPLAALAGAWNLLGAPDTGQSADSPLVLVVAGDCPGLQAEVLRACVAAANEKCSIEGQGDGAVVLRKGQIQPLLGCYGFHVGQKLKQAMEDGERRLMSACERLCLASVDEKEMGWPDWWTRPVHTPLDYDEWLRYAEDQAFCEEGVPPAFAGVFRESGE